MKVGYTAMSYNFHLAPPSKGINGTLAVPIDIKSIDALITFDGAQERARSGRYAHDNYLYVFFIFPSHWNYRV
jgi:hypothetical protein